MKKFFSNFFSNAWTVTILGGIIQGIALWILSSIIDINELNICRSSKTFSDTHKLNVLILPCERFETDNSRNLSLEKTLESRLNDKIQEENIDIEVLYDDNSKSPKNYQEAREIGIKKEADLVIFGRYFEISTKTELRYVFLAKDQYSIGSVAPLEGKTGLREMPSLTAIYEGSLQEDIDYIIYRTLALQKLNENDYWKALYHLGRFFPYTSEQKSDIKFMQAHCYYMLKNYDESLRLLDSAIIYNYKNYWAYNNRALIYQFFKRNPYAALHDFDSMIKLDSSETMGYYNRGNLFFYTKNYYEAISDYTIAIQRNTNDVYSYINRGTCYIYLKNYSSACYDLETALKINNNIATIYLNLGVIQGYLGNDGAAYNYYHKAIEIDSTLPNVYGAIGEIFQKKYNYDSALYYYSRGIQINPYYVILYTKRGSVFMSLGKKNEAFNDFKSAVAYDSNYAIGYNDLGGIYFEMKKPDISEFFFRKALSLDSNNSLILGNYGAYFYHTHDYNKALYYLNKSIEADNNNYISIRYRARTYIHLNKLNEANSDVELLSKNNQPLW